MCVALLLATMSWPVSVMAHGGGTPRLTGVQAGPYHVYAWTQPDPWRVGEAHLSVAVTLPDLTNLANPSETPVTDAQVNVTFTPAQQPENAIAMAARPTSLLGSYYEADANLPFAENWQILISVQGKEGKGTAQFSLPVLPPPSVNWSLVIGGAIALLALAGVLGMRTRLRGEPEPHRRSVPHQAH